MIIPINQTTNCTFVSNSIFLLFQFENQESISNQVLPILLSCLLWLFIWYHFCDEQQKINKIKVHPGPKELTAKFSFLNTFLATTEVLDLHCSTVTFLLPAPDGSSFLQRIHSLPRIQFTDTLLTEYVS